MVDGRPFQNLSKVLGDIVLPLRISNLVSVFIMKRGLGKETNIGGKLELIKSSNITLPSDN